MEKLYDTIKTSIMTFKLDSCCCFAPVRTGVFITGYFNMFLSFLYLVGTADGGITAPLMAVQEVILEDEASKIIGILAYGTELAFNMCLLCAMYRKDIVLLRTYMYFGLASIVASILVYSMVIAAVTLLTKIHVISTMVFQCYVILLVRSAMVEIKEEANEENGHITLYSVSRLPEVKSKDKSKDIDVEMAPETQPKTPETKPEMPKTKPEMPKTKSERPITKPEIPQIKPKPETVEPQNEISEHKEIAKLEAVSENPKED